MISIGELLGFDCSAIIAHEGIDFLLKVWL